MDDAIRASCPVHDDEVSVAESLSSPTNPNKRSVPMMYIIFISNKRMDKRYGKRRKVTIRQ